MRKHHFHQTTVDHHKDGSHTIHHHSAHGPEHDVHHAVTDLDGLHDSVENHLGAGSPNEGEADADEGMHGVPSPMAGQAGLPAQGE